jgi:transcriptional regulator with XRE-family HTH domain
MEKSIFTEDYLVFLRCLRDARGRAGLTQAQLAERLDQTQSWVSKCERGERRLDVVEVRAFCRAMGLPLSSFLAEFERAVEARGGH